jgi:hypothetical protein
METKQKYSVSYKRIFYLLDEYQPLHPTLEFEESKQ